MRCLLIALLFCSIVTAAPRLKDRPDYDVNTLDKSRGVWVEFEDKGAEDVFGHMLYVSSLKKLKNCRFEAAQGKLAIVRQGDRWGMSARDWADLRYEPGVKSISPVPDKDIVEYRTDDELDRLLRRFARPGDPAVR